jgi:SAM-dependent methyltransferase
MNLEKVEKLYSENIKRHGIQSKAVGWNSTETQNLRFLKLLDVVNHQFKSFSINELGVGYGELYNFLEKNNYEFSKFNGYDISQPMLDSCIEYLKKPNNLKLFNTSKISTIADYSVASGIFNVPFDNSFEIWKNYIKETIFNMYENSKLGISFNFLTDCVDYMEDSLYYQNPSEILDFCLKNFGRNIKLIHNYNLYEFTVIISKTQKV